MTEDKRRQEIQNLGLKAIEDFFKLDLSKFEDKTIQQIHSKARIAMQFERESNTSRRFVELNYLRIFKLVAEDKKELKSLIKKSLPKYLE